MQQWEYLTLIRNREFKSIIAYKPLSWNQDITAMLPDLGKEGWELAGIVSGSNISPKYIHGVTTDEMWVFKRPLE